MKIYSTSTLSKMNLIQLYHNARDSHSSTNVYVPVPNVLRLVPTHTVFSFFLASCEHDVATERADKSWFLSALIIPVSTCFLQVYRLLQFRFLRFRNFYSLQLSASLQWDISIVLVRIDLFLITFLSLWSQKTTFVEIPRYGKSTNWTLLLFQAIVNEPLWHSCLLLHVAINDQLKQKSAFDKALAMRKKEDCFANMLKILKLRPNIFPKKNIQPFLPWIIGQKNFTVFLYSYTLKWPILKFCIICNFRAYLTECAQVETLFTYSNRKT